MRVSKLILVGVATRLAVMAFEATNGGALDEDAEETGSEPNLIVSTPGEQLLLSRDLTVIKRSNRVIARTGTVEESTWRRRVCCYERHTEWSRDDARQVRDAL